MADRNLSSKVQMLSSRAWLDASGQLWVQLNGQTVRVGEEDLLGGGGASSDTVAALDGNAAAGTASEHSRGDHKHADANRPTDGEKVALAGTSGVPGSGNRFVTDAAPRNSNARTPAAHGHVKADISDFAHTHAASDIVSGVVAAARLGAGTPDSTKFLRGDQTWAAPSGGGGDPSAAWPVGSVFIAVVSTDPATLLGFGTWARIAQGRMLVGQDGADPDFDVAEEVGGEKSHALTVAEIPSHVHGELAPTSASGGAMRFGIDTNASGSVAAGLNTAAAGGGGAHNNMPPYLVVYVWKRAA